jgi:hypothetical protein
MANELPRELMESCLAVSQEATMQGFSESVLASAITPFVQRMMDTCYRMGFESGWRIREKQIASGVPGLPAASDETRNGGPA